MTTKQEAKDLFTELTGLEANVNNVTNYFSERNDSISLEEIEREGLNYRQTAWWGRVIDVIHKRDNQEISWKKKHLDRSWWDYCQLKYKKESSVVGYLEGSVNDLKNVFGSFEYIGTMNYSYWLIEFENLSLAAWITKVEHTNFWQVHSNDEKVINLLKQVLNQSALKVKILKYLKQTGV